MQRRDRGGWTRRRRDLLTAAAAAVVAASAAGGCSVDRATDRPSFERTTTVPTEAVPGSRLPGEAAFLGPVRTIELDPITVSYRRFGRGPELVLVGGLAAPMSRWPLPFLERLARKHTVTIYDQRGLGRTTDEAELPLTLNALAEDLDQLIGALALGHVDVIGWSTGGDVALTFAAWHPNHVHRVVVSGASLGGPATVQGDAAAVALAEGPSTPPAAVLPLLFGPANTKAAAEWAATAKAVPQTTVAPAVVERYVAAQHAFIGDDRFPGRWKQISVPVLVHGGQDDPLVPARNVSDLVNAIPGADGVITPNARHAALFEPGALARFEAFLAP